MIGDTPNGSTAYVEGRRERAPASAGFDRDAGGRVPPYLPSLVITRGRGAGREEALGASCVVGRDPESDLFLEDLGVSRRHARIARKGAVYVLHDLGSRNGTIVNGQSVSVVPLRDGDVIRFGRVELRFRWRALVA